MGWLGFQHQIEGVNKRIKYVLMAVVGLYLLAAMSVILVRMPSYGISTEGSLYVVNKVSRDLQVIDLANGKELYRIPIEMECHEAQVSEDQRFIFLTNYGAIDSDGSIIKRFNTQTNTIDKVFDIGVGINVNGMAGLKNQGKLLLVDYVANSLLVWNKDTGSIEKQIPTQQKRSHLAVPHPKEPKAYVTNMGSNSVSSIDLDTNKVDEIIACGKATESIDIRPDGSEVWATNKDDNSICVINTKTQKVIDVLPTGKEPLKIKFSVDGIYCLVANAGDGTISVFSSDHKKEIKTIRIPGKKKFLEKILYHTPRPVNILMHPNGKYAFVSNSNASKIEVIDMEHFELLGNLGTGKIPDALALIE
jgi:YVTN family beta-propeller protein